MKGEINTRFRWAGVFVYAGAIKRGALQAKALLLIRLVVAGVFVYAGAIKLIQPDTFLGDIESYRMTPYPLAWTVAFYLPPLEILCGLGLLRSKTRRASAAVLIGLLLVFIVAIAAAWLRGLEISCGCFGTSEAETNYLWLILRDLLIIGGLLFSMANAEGGTSPSANPMTPPRRRFASEGPTAAALRKRRPYNGGASQAKALQRRRFASEGPTTAALRKRRPYRIRQKPINVNSRN